MTTLVPMSAQGYERYLAAAIAGYAADNVAVGRWLPSDALERSRLDFAESLPQGLATLDNYLFEIHAALEDATSQIGVLWVAIELRQGVRMAYVYDLEIAPEARRQGHAQRAFAALEPLARQLGATSIGLHVFAHNPGAQALYAKLGYAVTGHNMHKPLTILKP